MATIEFLDDERAKLWAEVNDLKKQIETMVSKLSQVDNATLETVKSGLAKLDLKISDVRKVAESKTPEDVQTASRAAQEAVKLKDAVKRTADDAEEFRNKLVAGEGAYAKIRQIGESATGVSDELGQTTKRIAAIKLEIETAYAALQSQTEKCEKLLLQMTKDSGSVQDSVQNISKLNNDANALSAELLSSKDSVEKLKEEALELKGDLKTFTETAKKRLSDLCAQGEKDIVTLYRQKKSILDELTETIRGLLPGASSIALSKSFEERKLAVQDGRSFWKWLLVASALLIVTFGCVSLWVPPANRGLTAIFTRSIIIAGLVILEEFARRNYSATFRLSEAYAYKEAICKSLVGFKKELGDIPLPGDDGAKKTVSASKLAETFLEKLGDEPGRRVFEKNKPAFGLIQAIVQAVNPQVGDSQNDPAAAGIIGVILSKLTWQLVVVVTVLALVALGALFLILQVNV